MPQGLSFSVTPTMCLYSRTPGTQDHISPKELKWKNPISFQAPHLPRSTTARVESSPSLNQLCTCQWEGEDTHPSSRRLGVVKATE